MDRSLISEIVARALAPAPISTDGQPIETPFKQRLQRLDAAIGSTQQRVRAQQEQLAQIKRQIDDYRELVNAMKTRAVEAQRKATAPEAKPAEPPVAVVPFSFPEKTPVLLGRLDDTVTVPAIRSHPWLSFAPYAMLAGLGLVLHVGQFARQPVIRPLRAAASSPRLAPSLAPIASDEEANAQALALVYAYVPPGSQACVAQILGPELSSTPDSPWTLMRVDDKTTLVSYRPYSDILDNGPIYEFAVDTTAKTVQASPETLANLGGGVVASAR